MQQCLNLTRPLPVMTDIYQVLPNLNIQPFKHVQQAVERKQWSVAEVLSNEATQLSRLGPIPLKEIDRYQKAVKNAVKRELESTEENKSSSPKKRKIDWMRASSAKFLDSTLDECVGGGLPVGQITEIVGESGVGKTQFVLSLLCSSQLPAPYGLGRDVIYISTESALVTRRLKEIIAEHLVYQSRSADDRPSLDRIHFCSVNTFDQQDLVIHYQLPAVLKRHDIGLIVVDSIAANFRVEYQATTKKSLVDRAAQLQKLGVALKQIAVRHKIAVVVTNQVSDRFDDVRALQDRVQVTQASSHRASSSLAQHSTPYQASQAQRAHEAFHDEVLSLDYQQCFFTGWGDDQNRLDDLKTPALGLTWANQVSGRIALKLERSIMDGTEQRKRYFKVVYASFAPTTMTPVRYEIRAQGPVAVTDIQGKAPEGMSDEEYAQILDPNNWLDDDEDDFSGYNGLPCDEKGSCGQIDGADEVSFEGLEDEEFP